MQQIAGQIFKLDLPQGAVTRARSRQLAEQQARLDAIEADLTPSIQYSRVHTVQLPATPSTPSSQASVVQSAFRNISNLFVGRSAAPSVPATPASEIPVPELTTAYIQAPCKRDLYGELSEIQPVSSPSLSPVRSESAATSFSSLQSVSLSQSESLYPFLHSRCGDLPPIDWSSQLPVTYNTAESDSDSDDESEIMSRTVQTYRGAAGPPYSVFKNEVQCALAEKLSKKALPIDVIFQLIEGWTQPESQAFCYIKDIQDTLMMDHIAPVVVDMEPSTIVPVMASDPDPNRVEEELSTADFHTITNDKTGVSVIMNLKTRRRVSKVDIVLAIFWKLMDRRFAAATSMHVHEYLASTQGQSDSKETAGAFAARLAAQLTGMGGKVTESMALRVWFTQQKDLTIADIVRRQMEDFPAARYTLLTAERLADAVESRRDEDRVLDHQIAASKAALQPATSSKATRPKATFPSNLPAPITDDQSPDAPCCVVGHRGHKNRECRQQHPELPRKELDTRQLAAFAKAFMTAAGTSAVNVTAAATPVGSAPAPAPAPTAGYVAKQAAKVKAPGQPPKTVNPVAPSGKSLCATCGHHPAHLPCYIIDPRSAPEGWAPIDNVDPVLINMWRAARKKQGLPEPAPKLRRVPRRFRDDPPAVHCTVSNDQLPEPITDYDEDGLIMSAVCHLQPTATVNVLPRSFIPKSIPDPPGTLGRHITSHEQIQPDVVSAAAPNSTMQFLHSLAVRVGQLEAGIQSCHRQPARVEAPLLSTAGININMDPAWVQAYLAETVDIPYASNSSAADGLVISSSSGKQLLSQHALIDTGSNQCIMHESVCNKLGLRIFHSDVAPIGFGGEASPVLGCTEQLSITLKMGTAEAATVRSSFLVVRAKHSLYDILIGIRQLHSIGAMPDPLTRRLYFRPQLYKGDISHLASIPMRMTPIDQLPVASVCCNKGIAAVMVLATRKNQVMGSSPAGSTASPVSWESAEESLVIIGHGSIPSSSSATPSVSFPAIPDPGSDDIMGSSPTKNIPSPVSWESAESWSISLDHCSIPSTSSVESPVSLPAIPGPGSDDVMGSNPSIGDDVSAASGYTIPWEAGDYDTVDLSPAGMELQFSAPPTSPTVSQLGGHSASSLRHQSGGELIVDDAMLAAGGASVSRAMSRDGITTKQEDAILQAANLRELFSLGRHKRHHTFIPPLPSHCTTLSALLVVMCSLLLLVAGLVW